jgi:hypothetical protein
MKVFVPFFVQIERLRLLTVLPLTGSAKITNPPEEACGGLILSRDTVAVHEVDCACLASPRFARPVRVGVVGKTLCRVHDLPD